MTSWNFFNGAIGDERKRRMLNAILERREMRGHSFLGRPQEQISSLNTKETIGLTIFTHRRCDILRKARLFLWFTVLGDC